MSDSRIPMATFYAELPSGTRPNCGTITAFQRQSKSQPTVNGHRPHDLGRPSWQQIQIAKSLLHWAATFLGSPHRQCSWEVQLTERFYKSVRPCSRVLRYKTLHMRRLWPTIYRKNWPRRSHEDPQEVEWDRSSYVVADRRLRHSSRISWSIFSIRSLGTLKIFNLKFVYHKTIMLDVAGWSSSKVYWLWHLFSGEYNL